MLEIGLLTEPPTYFRYLKLKLKFFAIIDIVILKRCDGNDVI